MGMTIDDEREMRANGITNVEIKHIKQLYEARLKTDMVAMLEDLKQDIIAEAWSLASQIEDPNLTELVVDVADIDKVIYEKINILRGDNNG